MDVNMWKQQQDQHQQQQQQQQQQQENGLAESNSPSSADSQISSGQSPNGPDPNRLKSILERTNYSHQVTAGQRKYGGPPPDWNGPPPPNGCEIFVGRIPKDVFEDELIPLFEKIGKLWDLRLMIEPSSAQSRGYAFITYCNKEDALKAVNELNGHKIRPKGYSIKVNISVPNLRLFIGNIPKALNKDEIFNEFDKVTEGLSEVIIYSSPDDRKKNRGFCFLEFDSHKNASAAKRKLTTAGMKIFKSDILVDWADPQEEPDEETMSKVKVLYVRNLTSDVTENQLKQMFEEFGLVERVKKIKDYAFIHFEDRTQALDAMENMNGKEIGGSSIEISLAKPPSDRRKKEEVLRNRERRMILMMQQKQMMMTYPRVPQSPMRPSIPPIPQMNASPMLPITRGGRNRYPQPFNPMMPVPFNRQTDAAWNQLMLYDPSQWYGSWYGSNRQGPQFNFGNVPPNAQWNYGLTNGQVPTVPPYCGNGPGGGPGPGGNRRLGPNNVMMMNNNNNTGGPGNAANGMNNNINYNNNNNNNNAYRRWRNRPNQQQQTMTPPQQQTVQMPIPSTASNSSSMMMNNNNNNHNNKRQQ